MIIVVYDVSEKLARKTQHLFQTDVRVVQNDDGLYDLHFSKGCAISTYNSIEPEINIFNQNSGVLVYFFSTDFSEVHII